MNTPFIWTLNLRTSAWLKAERDTWRLKIASLSGSSRADAQRYYDAVVSELTQRGQQVAGGGSWLTRALSNVTESLGGTGGAGASGATGGAIDTLTDTASAVVSGGKSIFYIVAGVAVIIGAIFVYVKFGKK